MLSFKLRPRFWLWGALGLMVVLSACTRQAEQPREEIAQVRETGAKEKQHNGTPDSHITTIDPAKVELKTGSGGPAMCPPCPPCMDACDELLIAEENDEVENLSKATEGYSRSRKSKVDRADGRSKNPSAAQTPDVTEGSLFAKKGEETVGQFPLKSTEVKAQVSGYLASTTLSQTFTNPFNEVIEAVYTFPMPGNAAINDFLMVIGERRIRGLIRPRAEAEKIYAEARARGQTASLLTQERPNIFNQNVANIEVGGQVEIKITYFETLNYENGRYEYVFPMVVGPRYIPGNPVSGGAGEDSGAPKVGGEGTAPGTERVPDAPKITPPILPEGVRSGHDISLLLDIDAGLPIDFSRSESVAHTVHTEKVSANRLIARLDDADRIANRDFVFRWGINADKPSVGLLAHRDERGGFFTLMLHPQLNPADADVTPREITFLIDVSGSQHGVPLEISQDISKRAIDALRPDDVFNVFFFAGFNGQLWDEPKPRTPENMDAAKAYIGAMKGSGGTEMLAGVQRALKAKHDPKRLQMYAFFTDGYIGNEAEVLRTIKEEKNGARFFCFGTGSSVNRYLCDGVAEQGDGKVIYCLPREKEQTEKAAKRFFECIDSPVLCDITIDFNGLPVADVYPSKVTDLFAGQPITLKGRYTGPAKGTIWVNGRIGAKKVSFPVEVNLPEKEDRNECLGAIWARQKISDLSNELLSKPDNKEIVEQITALALEFRLMSQYTSFVAVDESRIVGNGAPLKVMQPVELPESVSREGIEGKATGDAMSIGTWGMIVMQGKDGGVYIASVEENGAAGKAGIKAGVVLVSINGVAAMGLRHLEGLLLQSSGSTRVGVAPSGSDLKSITEYKLSQP
jgi:Ca-activated chloride channel family protein